MSTRGRIPYKPTPPPGKGRPKGSRNKANAMLKEAAQCYTQKALTRVAGLILSKDPDIALRACAMIWDRGHGKPVQAVNHADANGQPLDFTNMSSEQLDAVIVRLEAAITAKVSDGSSRPEGGETETTRH